MYCFFSDIPPQAMCVHQLCGAMLGYAALWHTSSKGSEFSVRETEKLPCHGRHEKLILFNLFKKIKYVDRLYPIRNFLSLQFPKVEEDPEMKFIFCITWATEIWLGSHVHCQKSLNWAGMSSAKACIFHPKVQLQVWCENTGVKFWRRGATAVTCNCPFYCWTPWISQHIQIV